MAVIIARIAFLVFLVAVLAGAVFLQIYLSKRESKWPGLILPAITFAISLLAIMGMAVYTHTGTVTQVRVIDVELESMPQEESINGEFVTTMIQSEGSREPAPGAIGGVIYTFTILNIPTAISLAIYKAARSKRNRLRNLEKMNVQDL